MCQKKENGKKALNICKFIDIRVIILEKGARLLRVNIRCTVRTFANLSFKMMDNRLIELLDVSSRQLGDFPNRWLV